MKNKKSRIFTVIIGFFVFVIPLLFLCITLNREFKFTKERIEEDLKEKLLQTVSQIEENLDPLNYLNSEFSDIHSKLFPDCPEEILDKIPDDSYTKSLYTKETLDKLVSLIKDRYSPVIVTLSNQDIKDIYAYFSPKLEEDIEKNSEDKNEKSEFLKNKTYLDSYVINVRYEQNFNKSPKNYIFELTEKEKKRLGLSKRDYYRLCYKYISRFSAYSKSNLLYTDYFNKQILFYILKYTMSSKGIHGAYTCLIPQSHIDPDLILNYARSKQDSNPFTNIELVKKQSEKGMIHTVDRLEYILDFPTPFISQVDAYKRLGGKVNSDFSNSNIKITPNYPKELKYFNILVNITNVLLIILPLVYIFFSFKIINKWSNFNIGLTNKLVIILSILLLFPILGIGLLSLIISNNLTEIVNLNLNKTLHNNLESVALLDKENDLRRFTSIVEIKKIISKIDLYKQLKSEPRYLNIFPTKNVPYWYYVFVEYFFIIPENGNGELFPYDSNGERLAEKGQNKRMIEITKIILIKYLKNLGFYKKYNELNKEFLALTFIDKILKLNKEEKSVGQESISSRDFISMKNNNFSTFFYAKDKNKNNVYLYNKIEKNSKFYSFLNSYTDKNFLCFKPTSKYGDLNIAISFDNRVEGINSVFFPKRNKDKDVKKLVTKALNYRSSGRDKTEINNRNIIQEWIFSNDSPFVVMGMAEEKNIDFLKYLTNIILPVLLSYTIILLVLFSGFISIFIKKPINIIKKAIGLLEINNFGATIEAFSNDEFKNITDGFNEMSIAIKQKEQMKRYVSERLLQSVENNNVQEVGKGRLEKVSILSSDIRNFTGTSEKYEPSEIVEMLNSYFTKMQQVITANGGIIDKYIGDAIQAVFYDEPDKENQVIRASKAAIAMRKALKEFNEERKSKGLFTIENGIGIDTDVAITGTIGTAKGRKDFSVNGEVIERAAALEAKTKNTRSKILLSKKSVEELDCHTSSINVGASLVCKDESYSKIVNDNNTNHTPQQTYPCLITKDFDSESVELIDVR